ncbi:hypothetical protein BC829DRAFT_413220 [Chytridium lagenaria]|nr:hypothetical protein BC829DRAFT_413220 [Chytridium lagenaria]
MTDEFRPKALSPVDRLALYLKNVFRRRSKVSEDAVAGKKDQGTVTLDKGVNATMVPPATIEVDDISALGTFDFLYSQTEDFPSSLMNQNAGGGVRRSSTIHAMGSQRPSSTTLTLTQDSNFNITVQSPAVKNGLRRPVYLQVPYPDHAQNLSVGTFVGSEGTSPSTEHLKLDCVRKKSVKFVESEQMRRAQLLEDVKNDFMYMSTEEYQKQAWKIA